jgi:hypothetical protein
MALDIFGKRLYAGDVVAFSDIENYEALLTVFRVEEVIDDSTVLAYTMSGDYIGRSFYLENTQSRCMFVRDVFKAAELKRNSTIN